MSRFVLRYTGEGDAPDGDVARVRDLPSADVLDASPKMLLVEGDHDPLRELVDGMSGWMLAPQQQYAVPDTRRKVERPPDSG